MNPLLLTAIAGCRPPSDSPDAQDVSVRFATFNVSMFRERAGQLISDLEDPEHEQARLAAAILQEVRPDVLLLNEVDWDAGGEAVQLLRENFLERAQDGREPLRFEHWFVPPVNTGVHAGADLDGNGQIVDTPGSDSYANDAFGFGLYPGQYGLVVLSRFPIETPRTFQTLLWKDMPDAWLPEGYYTEDALAVLRLSSKTHADVPIPVNGEPLHFLVSHPTPPTFDGPEDKNGRRNHDEIRFWTEYIDAAPDGWPVDDAGRAGGLGGGRFVIAGDLNADPFDGDSSGDPASALLSHPSVNGALVPASAGGAEQAALQGDQNVAHLGDPANDTADFNDSSVGNLRIDYVLPSADLEVLGGGVFWPATDDPSFPLVGTYPFPVSDHRLVWVDVRLDTGVAE